MKLVDRMNRGAPDESVTLMSGASWRLLALLPLGEDLIRHLLEPLDADITVPSVRDRDGLHAALADADLVVGDFTGKLAVDAEAVAAAPRLAFVQMPSVGVDSCDLDALTKAGVPVANTAGANARSVAEWAMAATFDLSRSLTWADRRMREGGWPQMETAAHGADELTGRRVGVLGMGAIGTEVVRLFSAIGCPVSYWSRRRRPDGAGEYKEIDELLATSDVLIVCLPLTDETRGLLDPRRLALLPDGALLVNVARGGIAPDGAVLGALESGKLAGAALDVYDEEPPPADHPLRRHENVLLSPHCAGATRQAQFNVITMVIDNMRAATEGRPVVNVVNGVDPVVARR
jgi:D-3-phosphoglycerate dehydrogenase